MMDDGWQGSTRRRVASEDTAAQHGRGPCVFLHLRVARAGQCRARVHLRALRLRGEVSLGSVVGVTRGKQQLWRSISCLQCLARAVAAALAAGAQREAARAADLEIAQG